MTMDQYRQAFRLVHTIRRFDRPNKTFGRFGLVQPATVWGLKVPHIVGESFTITERLSVPQSNADGGGTWLWTAMPTAQFDQLVAGRLPDPYILDRLI